jgi:uncharacterized LabA/DUF88 family protein
MRTAIFVDGSNLAYSCKALGFYLDFRKLIAWIEDELGHDIVRAFYYTAIFRDEDGNEYIRGIRDWLEYNGWRVVTKESKQFEHTVKGNMDVELAIDMYRMAPRLELIYLFSGDGDFRYAVEQVQDQGCKVIVCSGFNTIADELRRQADEFIDLKTLTQLRRD